jgi:hypothetical protein
VEVGVQSESLIKYTAQLDNANARLESVREKLEGTAQRLRLHRDEVTHVRETFALIYYAHLYRAAGCSYRHQ